ncbi:MAG: hypothetical protein HY078_08030 [Elusimicrobia bacterium]|nr:hypothetical protein [Elusimicrobiota bacterium]
MFSGYRTRDSYWIAPAAAAVALAWLRMPVSTNQYVGLLAHSYLEPTSLSQDLIVRAAQEVPYTFAPRALAAALAGLASLGLAVDTAIPAIHLVLWVLQAALMYRLARAATESDAAAALATLFFGLDMPLTFADAPYALQFLERSLGMVPLLWGLKNLVEGRRWQALAGVGASTYLHANPAIYLWPVIALEDLLEARRRPETRVGFALRGLLAATIAAPLLYGVARSPLPHVDPEFARLNLLVHAPWIGGRALSAADYVFAVEGALLVAVAAARSRRIPASGLLLRMIAACGSMLIAGTLAYDHYAPGTVWAVIVRMQLWLGLYVFEVAGQILLAAWLALEAEEGSPAWPAMLFILSLSIYHDFVFRLTGIALAACMFLRRRAAGYAVLAAAAALAAAHCAAPAAVEGVIRSMGFKGGLFRLPAFHPAFAAALVGCGAAGWAASRGASRPSRAALTSAAAALFLAINGWRSLHARTPADEDAARMAAWIRQHAPPSAVVLASPLGLVGSNQLFMDASRRSLFAYSNYGEGLIMYGSSGEPMGARLRAIGVDMGRVLKSADYDAELERADRGLTVESAAALAKNGVDYLLIRGDRPWPEAPVHREGGLALYGLPSAARPPKTETTSR